VDDFNREAMLEMFVQEMTNLIDQLENNTIQNDEDYSMDMINEIFRVMHTIKGSASMMLFNSIATTSHAIEDLFFYLRENAPDNVDYPGVTDLVLEVVDFIKLQLSNIENDEEIDPEPQDLIANIKIFVDDLKGIDSNYVEEPAVKSEAKVADTTKVVVGSVEGLKQYKAKIFFQSDSEMENVRAYTLVHNLEEVAVNITHIPSDILEEAEASAISIRENGFNVRFYSEHDYNHIEEILMQSIFIRELDLQEVQKSGKNVFDVVIRFQNECEMENVRAYTIVHNLQGHVDSIIHQPQDLLDEANIDVIRQQGFKMEVVTDKPYDDIHKMLAETIYLESLEITERDKADTGAVVEAANVSVASLESAKDSAVKEMQDSESKQKNKGAARKDKSLAVEEEKPKDKKKAINHSISVNVHKLDQLLNLVGELVISEAMVTQNPELEGLELDSFTKESRQLRKIITDIQDTVMSMRMVPLSPTFFKMHRIVRDMCKQLKKEVQLEVIGDDTEVDKNIIEHISDPLMHIIRNSVDHGIEMPSDRLEAGKDEKGTVTLEAKNSGGDVLILIKDDGAGFKRDKIMAKAKKQDLLTKPEEDYSDKEVFQFIFLPGFSTNEEVTSYSGRGVGMDVVSTNIEHVGGTVIADSIEGEGSMFTLKIPLTLAIIEGMIINIGDAKYTIPIISIKRSFKATMSDIVLDPNNNEMIMVRGECYNLVRLNTYFNLNIGTNNIEDGIVLMLENGDQTVCVFADELIGEQQVVVKNMPKYIKKVHGLSGCTLLGNGDISLIIDVAGFFDR